MAVRKNLGKNGLIERADMDGRFLAVVVRKKLGQNGLTERADMDGQLLAGSPTTGLKAMFRIAGGLAQMSTAVAVLHHTAAARSKTARGSDAEGQLLNSYA